MKRIFTLCIVLCTMLTGFAQTDTTGKAKTGSATRSASEGSSLSASRARKEERLCMTVSTVSEAAVVTSPPTSVPIGGSLTLVFPTYR